MEPGPAAAEPAPPRRTSATRWAVLVELGAWLAAMWPLTFALALHAQWLHAWSLIGHRPRTTLDDPNSIVGLRGWALPAEIGLAGVPLATLVVAAVALARVATPRLQRPRALRHTGTAVLVFVSGLLLLWTDPLHAVSWWLAGWMD